MKSKPDARLTLCLVVCLMTFLLMPIGAVAGSISLSYANFPPAPTFPCVQMERWKTEVEKRTNGAVSIKTYPGGTLLGAKEMMDGVIAGQADIGNLCMAYQPGRFIVTNATSLPLGIPNARTGSLVLWDLYKKYQPEAFSQVKVLTMFTTAPANIMSKTAVRSLDDIQGMDLRASGGAAQILKAWGANQVGMPMSARRMKIYSEMRLLRTPLPSMRSLFFALKAVASSLKCCTSRPGSGPSYRILALPS